MHNKTNPLTRHPALPKPWKVVRGKHQRILIYKFRAAEHDVCPLQSDPDHPQYFTTTSRLQILQLAKLLAESPPVPKSQCKKSHASIPKSLRGEVSAEGR